MDPLNYQFADPSAAILNGIKTSAVLGDIQQNAQANQLKMQQAQLAQQQALQQQAELNALASNPNAGAADYAGMMTKYPGLAEHLGKAFNVLDDSKKQNLLNFQIRVHSAQLAGNNKLAAQLLRDRAEADPAQAQHYTTMADLIEAHPETARAITGLSVAAVLGPKEYAAGLGATGKEARDAEQAPADLLKKESDARVAQVGAANAVTKADLDNKNIRSQIRDRDGRLALDNDKLYTETMIRLNELKQKANTLDDGAKTIINNSTIASVSAEQSAAQMFDLANRLEKDGGGYGAAGGVSEWLKSVTGNQDSMTQMRQEYNRLRTSAALKLLPPGPASDKDIQIVMKGFPSDTGDAAYLASFMRGMAKLHQQEAVMEGARAEWVNAVGHTGKPKTDIAIDGVQVPAGTTFPDFMRQYAPKAMAKKTAEQVQTRSYMRWAQPQAQPAPATAAQSNPLSAD